MEGISIKKLKWKTVDIGDGILIKASFVSKKWSDSIYHSDGSVSAPRKTVLFGETPYSLHRFTCGCKIL